MKIRRALLSYFSDLDCITFCRPVNEEKYLNKLTEVPNFKIKKEFFGSLEKLKGKILEKCRPKIFKGTLVNS